MSEQYVDLELVKQAKAGNKKAFDLLVLKYQNKILKVISRYIPETADRLDVCQESFLKAFKAIDHFRGDSNFYTWLYRIAINTAKNHILAKQHKRATVDIENAEVELQKNDIHYDITLENFINKEDVEIAVLTTVEKLSEELKTAIILREIAGLSYKEIAEVMNCPIGTVRSRIFRARQLIDVKVKPLLK